MEFSGKNEPQYKRSLLIGRRSSLWERDWLVEREADMFSPDGAGPPRGIAYAERSRRDAEKSGV